jgi:oligopeptidase B
MRTRTLARTRARGQVPLMLYGYGSYGICMEPDFSATRLPLLDRGKLA